MLFMYVRDVKQKCAVLLGNFLEFYDFTLFAYMIPVISSIFFPSEDKVDSYTIGYIFLAIGFISRPVGAICFGFIGDKYGRRKALQISIILMAISTTGIGILPVTSNNTIYVLFALSIFRILQGLSAGGEYSGAGLSLIESAPRSNQYFIGAILTSTALLGAFVASFFAAISSLYDNQENIWRILFILGGILGFITFVLRMQLAKDYEPVEKYATWRVLINDHSRALFFTIACSGLMNVPFYIVTGFVNTYFIAIEKYSKVDLMFLNAFMTLFWTVCTIIFGLMSKSICPKRMMVVSSFGMAIFALPFFIMVNSGSFYLFVMAELILVLLSQFFVAPAFTTMATLFPANIRYRGLAVGNCLGIAILGGITPYLSSILIEYTGVLYAPSLYLFLVASLAFTVSIFIKKEDESELFQLNAQLQGEEV